MHPLRDGSLFREVQVRLGESRIAELPPLLVALGTERRLSKVRPENGAVQISLPARHLGVRCYVRVIVVITVRVVVSAVRRKAGDVAARVAKRLERRRGIYG